MEGLDHRCEVNGCSSSSELPRVAMYGSSAWPGEPTPPRMAGAWLGARERALANQAWRSPRPGTGGTRGRRRALASYRAGIAYPA